MADDHNDGNGGPPPEGAQQTAPVLQIVAQYVKDLSFENPGVGLPVQRPQMELGVDLQARKSQEGPYEVLLKIRVNATQEGKPVFLLELAYGGLFLLQNVPEDAVQPILLIECPRLLFPFARRIASDVVRDGGLPPLMIEPIDFAALYRSKMNEAMSQRGTQPAPVS